MNTSQRPDSSEPGGFLEALRGRWQIAPGLAVLGLLAAAAYVLAAPAAYTATAAVRPATAPGTGIVLLPVQVPDLRGDAQAARSTGVAAMAGKMLHSSLSPLALSKQVTVTVPPDTGVLDIGCTASSARGAADCANVVANAYLQNRTASAKAVINQQIAPLKAQIRSLQGTAARLSSTIIGLPMNSAERTSAQAQLASVRLQLSSLNGQVAALYAELAQINGGTVITKASPPAKPASPNTTLVLPGGLAAGLLLGLIAEFWLDRRDKQIRSAVVR
jgi:uncharacterized protein involved in exopolysaccharide biosynthesis